MGNTRNLEDRSVPGGGRDDRGGGRIQASTDGLWLGGYEVLALSEIKGS